jgi:transmembrane sensor
LLEGKVKVSKDKNTVYLDPGQQAVNTGNVLKVNEADTELAVAWKNGYFQFDKADLQTIMRQLARWYDADVAYEGNIPHRVFSGKIHRNLNASESLEMLKYFKVNYKLEGKKIIITP